MWCDQWCGCDPPLSVFLELFPGWHRWSNGPVARGIDHPQPGTMASESRFWSTFVVRTLPSVNSMQRDGMNKGAHESHLEFGKGQVVRPSIGKKTAFS